MDISGVRALLFDTYGTVVDYRSGVIAACTAFGAERGLSADWPAFVDAWRAGPRAAMDAVRAGDRPWTDLETLRREVLDRLVADFGLTGVTEEDKDRLNAAWDRLDPWPDAVPGLMRLKRKFLIAPLSNGTTRGMVAIARHAGLPWDLILASDTRHCYKPDAGTYRMAIELLGPAPEQVMMVAAHNYDLKAAQGHGMPTAFVVRPTEHGPAQTRDLTPEGDWDVSVDSFPALADALRA